MKRLHAFTLAEGATHVDISGNIHRVAFTLAEVLITLAIIGVVAALTIPTLVTNYQKKSYVTGLQKSYSQLLNGFKLMAASEGVEYLADTQFLKDLEMLEDGATMAHPASVLNSINKNLTKYFRIANACLGANQNDCSMYKVNYKYLNGSEEEDMTMEGLPYFQLQDGTTVFLAEVNVEPPNNNIITIFLMIDINGEKGPNTFGRDLFGNFALLDFENKNNNIVRGSIRLISYSKYAGELGEFHYDKYSDLGDEAKYNCGIIGNSDISEATGTDCIDRIVEEGWKMNY